MLGGTIISSGECHGFLHTLKKFENSLCIGCDDLILRGEKYVQLSVYNADPVCLDCFVFPAILGVKQYYNGGYGFVECEYFLDKESAIKQTKRTN